MVSGIQENKRKLSALVGVGAAALLLSYLPQFEGVVLRGYRDPIGIVTACVGHTTTAVLGRPYTKEECEELLAHDLEEHAEGVMACLDANALTTGQRAAAISFAFNVGIDSFCRSTFAMKLRLGVPACDELDRWVYAGGEVLPGLVKRRATERAMCEGKLG